MFADYPPELANTGGARWNPPGVDAIYASLERETALAEGEHRLQAEPIRPRAKRTLYVLHVRLAAVIDLRDDLARHKLGLSEEDLADNDMARTAQVGGAVEWLGSDGLLVPSVRALGTNLVIYPNRMEDGLLDREGSEVINELNGS